MTTITVEIRQSPNHEKKRDTYNINAANCLGEISISKLEEGHVIVIYTDLEHLASFIDFCSQKYTTLSIRILPF